MTAAFQDIKECVCAVCDNVVIVKECKPRLLSKISENIMKAKLPFPENSNRKNRECYDASCLLED